jgi:D-alanyl-D-alanine carboxypeptidase/D-alanyl-D-alanine-endopeptidase (penicillin-binding protein 4)
MVLSPQKLKLLLWLVLMLPVRYADAQRNEYINKISNILNSLKDDTALIHSSWGFCLINDASGKTVLERDSKKSLQPASTMKVLTTGAALSILGSDFTFNTRLGYTGKLSGLGILNGDIYIKGGGDPTLGFNRIPGVKDENALLKSWLAAATRAGLRSLHGRVIADATYFEKAMQPNAWAWDDIANYFGAGPCGLSFHENQYTLFLKQGKKAGDSTKALYTNPRLLGLEAFQNEIVAGPPGSGDNGYIYGGPYTFRRDLRGTIPPGDSIFGIKGSLPDPALQLAYMFQNIMPYDVNWGGAKLATTYSLKEMNTLPDTSHIHSLLVEKSPPLKTILLYTNTLSINLYAETLLKQIGKTKNGIGSTEAGLSALKAFWKSKGLDLGGMFVLDGSGLSRYDAVTAEQLASAMHIMRREAVFPDFYASLPVAGHTGSLSGIGKGTPAEGNIHAKSGYMSRVRSYAGYVRNKSGQDMSFCFMINNYSESAYSVKMKIEKLLVALAE